MAAMPAPMATTIVIALPVAATMAPASVSVTPVPVSAVMPVKALAAVMTIMVVIAIPVAWPFIAITHGWGRSSTPLRRCAAQEVHRLAASMVLATVAAPVARMPRWHPHIDGLHLRHHRAAPHGLRVQHLRRSRIADVDLAIDARSELAGDGATDIGLSLGEARSAGQSQRSQSLIR